MNSKTIITALLVIAVIFTFGLGCQFGQLNQTKIQPKDSKEISKTKDNPETQEKTLIGRWKSSVATVEIRADGKMTINGQLFNYRVNGSTMTISNNQETADLPFQLDGDTLTVQVKGRDIVYQRLSGNTETTQSSGSVQQELVGKWCYLSNIQANDGGRMSERCFVLNADGTYQYHAETSSSNPYGGSDSVTNDSGRWSATPTTLTGHSNTGESRTYTLEKRNHPKNGDPMLMVDGEAYVTFNQRQPW
jgi:hypothetical protein